MGVIKQENMVDYDVVYQELLQRREEVNELMKQLKLEQDENRTLRERLANEEIRRLYKGALIREQDRTGASGFAKFAIEEIVHYLDMNEVLADLSSVCKQRLEDKKRHQSR